MGGYSLTGKKGKTPAAWGVLWGQRCASLPSRMFGGAPWWVLALLALAIVAALSVWLWRAQNRLVAAALGLLIGGALGNVLDRLRHGAVMDFLDFHLGVYHWPAFNLADVAVVSGVALLLLDGFRAPQEQRHGQPEEGENLPHARSVIRQMILPPTMMTAPSASQAKRPLEVRPRTSRGKIMAR